MRRLRYITSIIVFCLVAGTLVGCSPRLSPLYRDFSITPVEATDQDIHERLTSALEEGGWTVIDGVTSNIVATESRRFREWGIYSMEVELEASPVGDGHVRLFIHPYRRYFTGSRGKMPYLKPGLAKSVLKTLESSFDSHGLAFAGTRLSRDQAHRREGQ